MVEDVTNDFEALEYSATTAGAVLDTLALVSGGGISQGADPQVGRITHVALVPILRRGRIKCVSQTS